MILKKGLKSMLAGVMSASLLASALVTPMVARAAIPGAGQPGYASLHEYVSRTDIPGVYKVTLSLSGFPDAPPATEVVVLIDASASMNETAVAAPAQRYAYDSIGMSGGRTSIGSVEGLYPDIASSDAVDTFMGGSEQALWLHPLQGVVKDLGGRSIPGPVSQPSAITAPDGKTYKDTRIYTALTAAQNAVEAFLTPETNPGADNTAVGVATFSSNGDALDYPFGWEPVSSMMGPTEDTFWWHAATAFSTYGYGTLSDMMAGGAITYTSRLGDYDLPNYDPNQPNLAFIRFVASTGPFAGGVADTATAAMESRPYFQYMLDVYRGNTVPQGSQFSSAHIQSLAERGLMVYDQGGQGRELLKKDLENVFAGTSAATTHLRAGLDEVNLIFGGTTSDSGVTASTADYSSTGADPDTRRFVIVLSDFQDNDGGVLGYDPAGTFKLIDAMKLYGNVEFMPIGISTEGATASSNGMNDKGSIGPNMYPGENLVNGGYGDPADVLTPPTANPGNWSIYGLWMGTKLGGDVVPPASAYNIGYADWSQVHTSYANWNNWSGETPNYQYAETANDIKQAFQNYVNQIIFFGTDAKGDLSLNTQAYELYSYPGKPMFETTGTAGQKVSRSGGGISWDMNGGIPLTKENTLSFYVKMYDDLDENLSYSVLSGAGFSCYGPFPDADNPGGKHPNGGWPDRLIQTSWPAAFIAPGGEITGGGSTGIEGGLGSGSGSGASATKPTTGGEAHQGNRQSAKDAMMSVGATYNVNPDIRNVVERTSASGRPLVSVDVSNGARMRYQWQYYDETISEWVDIFGANGSTHTLGIGFKTGQIVKLRCIVTNQVGVMTISDVIEVKVGSPGKGAGLQSRP